jgi:hypothetical protein
MPSDDREAFRTVANGSAQSKKRHCTNLGPFIARLA